MASTDENTEKIDPANLFSPAQIFVASLLGSCMAAFVMMAANYLEMKRTAGLVLTILVAIVVYLFLLQSPLAVTTVTDQPSWTDTNIIYQRILMLEFAVGVVVAFGALVSQLVLYEQLQDRPVDRRSHLTVAVLAITGLFVVELAICGCCFFNYEGAINAV